MSNLEEYYRAEVEADERGGEADEAQERFIVSDGKGGERGRRLAVQRQQLVAGGADNDHGRPVELDVLWDEKC